MLSFYSFTLSLLLSCDYLLYNQRWRVLLSHNDKMNEIRGALAPIHNTENVGKIHAPGVRLSEAVDGPDQLRTHLMACQVGI